MKTALKYLFYIAIAALLYIIFIDIYDTKIKSSTENGTATTTNQ